MSASDAPRVSVVVAARDDALSLYFALRRLPAVHEIIVVEDGTVEGIAAAAVAARPGARVIGQPRTGYGNAIATGLRAATGDILVTVPGDGSANQDDVESAVAALVHGADVAHGSRAAVSGGASWLVAGLHRVLFRHRPTGIDHAVHAMWADVVPHLGLPETDTPHAAWGDGEEIDLLIACRLAHLDTVDLGTRALPPVAGEGPRRPYARSPRALMALMRERRLAARRRRAVEELSALIDVIDFHSRKDAVAA